MMDPDENDDVNGKTKADGERNTKALKAGIGIGIGSAAIVAALLYANSARKKKGRPKSDD